MEPTEACAANRDIPHKELHTGALPITWTTSAYSKLSDLHVTVTKTPRVPP